MTISHNKIIFINFKDCNFFIFQGILLGKWVFKNAFFRRVFYLNYVIQKIDMFCPYWLYMSKKQIFLNIISVWSRWRSVFMIQIFYSLLSDFCCFFSPLYTSWWYFAMYAAGVSLLCEMWMWPAYSKNPNVVLTVLLGQTRKT